MSHYIVAKFLFVTATDITSIHIQTIYLMMAYSSLANNNP